MVKSNGGEVSTPIDYWQLFPFLDTSDRKRLKRSCNDIVLETNKARERAGFPADVIAIGDNGGGDLLVLGPRTDDPCILGPVYWWDHETGELIEICDDFGDLELRFGSLHPLPSSRSTAQHPSGATLFPDNGPGSPRSCNQPLREGWRVLASVRQFAHRKWIERGQSVSMSAKTHRRLVSERGCQYSCSLTIP
jgi:hypothetical protein